MFVRIFVSFSLAVLLGAPPLAALAAQSAQAPPAAPAAPPSPKAPPAPVPPTAVPAPPAPPAPAAVAPQTPPAPPAPPAPAAPQVPRAPAPPPEPKRLGQLTNVLVEVTVTDQVPGGQPARRVISATAADGERASVRNNAEVAVRGGPSYRPTGLSLDVRPVIAEAGRVRVDVGLEFSLVDEAPAHAGAGDTVAPAFGSVRLTQNVVLESGRPVVISQSTAPNTQRTVTVEVKATVLK